MIGETSALVRAASDGKHVPRSHPVLRRLAEDVRPAVIAHATRPRYAPSAIVLARKERRRLKDRIYRRKRYHTDPEYRARHIAEVAAMRATPEGRARSMESARRRYAARRGQALPVAPIALDFVVTASSQRCAVKRRGECRTADERRARRAMLARERYATDPAYRERVKAAERARHAARKAKA